MQGPRGGVHPWQRARPTADASSCALTCAQACQRPEEGQDTGWVQPGHVSMQHVHCWLQRQHMQAVHGLHESASDLRLSRLWCRSEERRLGERARFLSLPRLRALGEGLREDLHSQSLSWLSTMRSPHAGQGQDSLCHALQHTQCQTVVTIEHTSLRMSVHAGVKHTLETRD